MIRRFGIYILTFTVLVGMEAGLFYVSPKFSSLFGSPKTAQAATFNPNVIISDSSFRNTIAMNEDDIQFFLINKGSMLVNYSQNGKSAARIIYEAANGITSSNIWQSHPDWARPVRINPQVLLATLQKEQSLITGKFSSSTFSQRARIAMGYGCPDSGGCDSQYYGFYNQVNLAAWQFDWNFERSVLPEYSGYKVGQRMTFPDYNGNHTVTIGNQATASLYRYTPHVYNGNYNFWRFMNDWFAGGQSVTPATVARVSDGAPVYILAEGKKWPFADTQTFSEWGFTADSILTKTQQELDALPLGTAVTTLARGSSGSIYLIEDGRRRHIRTRLTFAMFVYSYNNVITLPNSILATLPGGNAVSHLITSPTNRGVYLIGRDTIYRVSSKTAFNKMGLSWSNLALVPDSTMNTYKVGQRVTHVIKGSGSTIYLFINGAKYRFYKSSDYRHWRFKGGDLARVSNDLINIIPNGKRIGRLIRGSDNKLYVLENGKRRRIMTSRALRRYHYKSSDAVKIPTYLFKSIPRGKAVW